MMKDKEETGGTSQAGALSFFKNILQRNIYMLKMKKKS